MRHEVSKQKLQWAHDRLFRCHCFLSRSQSCVPFGQHHGSRDMAEADAAKVRTNHGLPSVYTASEI